MCDRIYTTVNCWAANIDFIQKQPLKTAFLGWHKSPSSHFGRTWRPKRWHHYNFWGNPETWDIKLQIGFVAGRSHINWNWGLFLKIWGLRMKKSVQFNKLLVLCMFQSILLIRWISWTMGHSWTTLKIELLLPTKSYNIWDCVVSHSCTFNQFTFQNSSLILFKTCNLICCYLVWALDLFCSRILENKGSIILQRNWFINEFDRKINIWLILRCWGNSSILCQQNSDAL